MPYDYDFAADDDSVANGNTKRTVSNIGRKSPERMLGSISCKKTVDFWLDLADRSRVIFATEASTACDSTTMKIDGRFPFIAYQYDQGFGFLDVLVTDDGHTMTGVFHANGGTIKDRFTIEDERPMSSVV